MVRMAVMQVGDVRMCVDERGVFVPVGVPPDRGQTVVVGVVAVRVVAVVVAVLMVVRHRLVGVPVLVAGPERQSDADDRHRHRDQLGDGHRITQEHPCHRRSDEGRCREDDLPSGGAEVTGPFDPERDGRAVPERADDQRGQHLGRTEVQ